MANTVRHDAHSLYSAMASVMGLKLSRLYGSFILYSKIVFDRIKLGGGMPGVAMAWNS